MKNEIVSTNDLRDDQKENINVLFEAIKGAYKERTIVKQTGFNQVEFNLSVDKLKNPELYKFLAERHC